MANGLGDELEQATMDTWDKLVSPERQDPCVLFPYLRSAYDRPRKVIRLLSRCEQLETSNVRNKDRQMMT